MKSAAVFVVGIVVAIAIMQGIRATRYSQYTWLYVAILLMGIAVFNRPGLMSFATDLQAKLKGG